MKKVFNSIFTIATVMMAAVSCQKEQVEPASQARLLSFSGNVIETKAVLGTGSDASHYAVKWEEGDAFCVNYGAKEGATAFKTVTMSNYIGNTSAEWSVFGVQDGGKDNVLRAIYPYQENYTNISNSAKYIAFSLPAIQTPEANGPDRNAVIMYAQTAVDVEDGEVKEDVSLSFSTIVAFGRIAEITGIPVSETVKDIVISATENMVGTVVKYNYDGRENPYTITGGSNIVTITPKALTNVWFTVCPGSYSDVKITVNTVSGKAYSKTSTGNLTFSADKVGKIASVAVTEEEVAPSVTLTNTNIVAAGNAVSGYSNWTLTDEDGNKWTAYAIKNQHSKATSAYHFLQIKANTTDKYYIQVPQIGSKITKIEMVVSNSNKPMTDGGNNAKLYFSADQDIDDSDVSATGSNNVTIDCSSISINTGYILASAAVRIWEVKVSYELGDAPTTPVVTPSIKTVAIPAGGDEGTITYTVENGNLTDVTITPGDNDWFTYLNDNTGTTGKITWEAQANPSSEARIFTMNLAVDGGNNVNVVFTQDGTPKVATPVISCVNNIVTITCATEGALIHYTLDGTTPSNEVGDLYDPNDKPVITQDCTVKAIAVLDSYHINSDVATVECVYQAAIVADIVTLDFSKSEWGFPTDYVNTSATYTDGTYSITCHGTGSNGWKKQGSGLIIGKKDAYIALPVVGFDVEKITFDAVSSSSGKVTFNIFVGDEAVSTECTATNINHEFEINEQYQAAGTQYLVKITNANNAQFVTIKIYNKNN